MENCAFCEICAKKKKEVVWENNFFWAMFDSFPVSPGHLLVTPKRHALSLLGLNKIEWATLRSTLQEAIDLIETTDLRKLYRGFIENPLNEKSEEFCKDALSHLGIEKKPAAYNFGVNDGEAAGRTVHHLNIHIIPRYEGDVESPVGGVRHVIPGKGNYKN